MLKRLLISLYSLTFLLATTAIAQINENSPFPCDVVVNSPSSIAGVYDYGTQVGMGAEEWGPRLSETVTGDVAWGYTAAGDSLGCEPVVTDLSGKMAMIRRGACNFSLKVYNAQAAGAIGCLIVNHYDDATQDGNSLVGMLGGDSLSAIVIPAAFISRNTGEAITSELDFGGTVSVSFQTKTFYDPVVSYSYHTPQDQLFDIDVFQINLINPDTMNSVTAEVTMEITDPNGDPVTFTATEEIGPASDSAIVFADTYLPTELGTYNVTFTNNLNTEEVTSAFVVTEDTWAVDNNMFTGSIGPADETFQNEYGLRYNTGSLYLTGDNGVIAPYVSFGIGNASILNDTGDETTFAIRLYDADADGDNIIDLENGFDDLVGNTIAGFDYTMDGNEEDNELIYVELESFVGSSVELIPNHAYYVAILYNGLDNGNGIAPRFTRSNSTPYSPNLLTTPLELDQLYSGWNGSNVVTRLHTENFVVDTEEEAQILGEDQVTLSPNPASDFVNLSLELENVADQVEVHIYSANGGLVRIEQFDGVRSGTFRIETADLNTGAYFFSVRTPEGMRTQLVKVFN